MDKTAFITGASGGIGFETAVKMAENGYSIAAVYNSDLSGAERLGNKLKELNVKFKLYQCDISKTENVKNICRDALDYFGGVSVLVNCAGISSVGLFTDAKEEEYDRVFGVNMKGVYNTCSALVPDMVRRKEGKIINISSMWGITGASCEVIYSASKAAVIGFTKALGKELAPSGITVNAIAPGAIDTKMNDNLTREEKESFAYEIPMGRFGRPEEIADLVLFLAGEGSSYITSQVITADGGLI